MPKTPRLVTAILFALALTFGLAAAAPSLAAGQPEHPPAPAADTAEPAEEGWGDQQVQGVRSKGPVEPGAGAYNWVFMAFAGVVVVATGVVLVAIIRKNSRQDA